MKLKRTPQLALGASILVNLLLMSGIYRMTRDHYAPKGFEIYRVDGDESPGIGGDEQHPDIALAWIENHELHIGYAPSEVTLAGIHHIDWPQDFTKVLDQTGEINSPVRFARFGDTLRVKFIEE